MTIEEIRKIMFDKANELKTVDDEWMHRLTALKKMLDDFWADGTLNSDEHQELLNEVYRLV